MENITEIIIKRLESIKEPLNNGNYASCARISHDLVSFAWTLKIKDEVFICETLEAIFYQIRDTFSERGVPNELKEKIRNELSTAYPAVITAYKNEKNSEELYNSLRELRYIATLHQLDIWQKFPVG